MEKTPSPIQNNESEPILTFEQFSHRGELGRSTYRNFWLHFSEGIGGMVLQATDHYKRFIADPANQTLDAALKTLVASADMTTNDTTDEIDQALYRAYVIMKSYGASDQELFG